MAGFESVREGSGGGVGVVGGPVTGRTQEGGGARHLKEPRRASGRLDSALLVMRRAIAGRARVRAPVTCQQRSCTGRQAETLCVCGSPRAPVVCSCARPCAWAGPEAGGFHEERVGRPTAEGPVGCGIPPPHSPRATVVVREAVQPPGPARSPVPARPRVPPNAPGRAGSYRVASAVVGAVGTRRGAGTHRPPGYAPDGAGVRVLAGCAPLLTSRRALIAAIAAIAAHRRAPGA